MAIYFPFLLVVSASRFGSFFASLGVLGLVIAALFFGLQLLRAWFRQLNSDIPLVALSVSRGPILAIVTAAGLNLLLTTLPFAETAGFSWLQRGLTALIVILGTYWLAQLFTQIATYILRQYAERTEAMWDDVLLPLLENTLPLLIYLVGGLLTIQTLGLNLTGLWVAIGGATFVLGFALKDILANFFSGLVLLIDTPFRFGDVILLPDGTRAVIKRIGLRVTNLYLIDSHSEVYIPNATLEGQNIVNLSRPTDHYYYDINVPIKADVDPARAIRLMEDVVLAHPDTMGKIEQKLEVIDKYYGFSVPDLEEQRKREAGRKRLMAEQEVSVKLMAIEQALAQLSQQLTRLEKGGLDADEIRLVQGDYLTICELIGLEKVGERHDRQKRFRLAEISGSALDKTLIGLIRHWYQCWLEDPDLLREDHLALPRDWEQKIALLKLKANKLFWKISEPMGQETRLDDLIEDLRIWMQERFKSSRNEWQDPKIWISEVGSDYTRETTVKFYVDNIKLEHCERGNRVKSEVYREMIWHLRQAYLSH
jgi:MscS family membrane protein